MKFKKCTSPRCFISLGRGRCLVLSRRGGRASQIQLVHIFFFFLLDSPPGVSEAISVLLYAYARIASHSKFNQTLLSTIFVDIGNYNDYSISTSTCTSTTDVNYINKKHALRPIFNISKIATKSQTSKRVFH